jgi:hypothetical protein
MKHFLSNITLGAAWFYISFQIYIGFTTGELNGIGRSARLVSQQQEPIWFYFVMCATILFNLVLLFFFLYSLFVIIDRKVKAYGGNYNINTFKAIIRGLRR